MKLVTQNARFHPEKCLGCKACARVCPTQAFTFPDHRTAGKPLPMYKVQDCRGCVACEQRCPAAAITIEKIEKPFTVGVDPRELDREQMAGICRKARVHPRQIVCFCTNTTAAEVVAAILKGAQTPEAISLMTGARTGCGIGCIQSLIKLLNASGHTVRSNEMPEYYGEGASLWDLGAEVENRYKGLGYHFEEDRQLLREILKKG